MGVSFVFVGCFVGFLVFPCVFLGFSQGVRGCFVCFRGCFVGVGWVFVRGSWRFRGFSYGFHLGFVDFHVCVFRGFSWVLVCFHLCFVNGSWVLHCCFVGVLFVFVCVRRCFVGFRGCFVGVRRRFVGFRGVFRGCFVVVSLVWVAFRLFWSGFVGVSWALAAVSLECRGFSLLFGNVSLFCLLVFVGVSFVFVWFPNVFRGFPGCGRFVCVSFVFVSFHKCFVGVSWVLRGCFVFVLLCFVGFRLFS